MTITIEAMKTGHRATWAAGDYAAVAEVIDAIPPAHLIERVAVAAGDDVLDVATGTGNVALRAAARGAAVTGLDLTPELFATARRRATEWGVEVEWVEGDAEELPFADATFDRVLSTFGVQFAPRHAVVAAELVRVTRPGGVIGLCNWTPEGQIGELFGILGRYLPPAPSFASPPPRWGDEAHVRALFTDTGADVTVECERATTPWAFASAEAYVAFMETAYGPLLKARERLTGEGTWPECRAAILDMLERRNTATDGTLAFPAEYLLTVVRRAC
jgi:ubiquinone/menaquinone biosynthesis C-methylase UbiE